MSKSLNNYEKIIFFGGGVMADRLYKQIDDIDKKLAAVFDLLDDNRKTKEFNGFKIQNVQNIVTQLQDENTAIVVAIGHFNVPLFVEQLLDRYGFIEDRLFVVNPYQSLRFFFSEDEVASEKRIPYDNEKYRKVEKFFTDEESIRIFKKLVSSKPFENINDTYELIPYNEIKDMYWCSENYWSTHKFDSAQKNSIATVIDCGAYIGDSVLPICNAIPEKKIHYIAVEPLKENIAAIKNDPQIKTACNDFRIIECGVGEKNEKLFFSLPSNGNTEGGRFINESKDSNNTLDVKRIDDLDIDYKGTIYIKMDIEGSELSALKGSIDTIKKRKPYLAICLYHRKNDLVEIPLFIDSLGVKYNYYLRGGYHTILWAIPQ